MSERTTLIALSLPYFIDFLAGLITFNLAITLIKEEEFRSNTVYYAIMIVYGILIGSESRIKRYGE